MPSYETIVIGTGGVGEVIIGQVAAGEDGLDEFEARGGCVAHGDGDGTVQFDDWRWRRAIEQVV